MRVFSCILTLLFFSTAGLSTAAADVFDIEFSRLGTAEKVGPNVSVTTDEILFSRVVRDLGISLAPKFMGPANSLGPLGFEVGFETSWTDIDVNAEHWIKATNGNPQSTITTVQLHIRKGLPFSLEVGGELTHLLQSDLWGVGMDVKFAAIEGFRVLPDLAIRANIHTILGSNDVHMLLTGGDVMISKEFGIAGVMRIAPYAGYNLIYVFGKSHQVTFFVPECTGSCSHVDLFNDVKEWVHRGVIGFQLVTAYFSIGSEVSISESTQTYTVHAGVDF